MTGLGLCVSPRYLPTKPELEELNPASLASILYRVSDIGLLLELAGPDRDVIVSLNNECDEVGSDWRSFTLACELIAERYFGARLTVCCGHELDLFWAENPLDCTPEFGASLVVAALPILRQANIKVSLAPVAGPMWVDWLTKATKILRDRGLLPDAIAADFYGQIPDGWDGWGFGNLRDCIGTARGIAGGLPIHLREYGIKLADVVVESEAGFERAQNASLRQSLHLRLTAQMLAGFAPDEVASANWFCWTDRMGKPDERGENAFGLVAEQGNRRPAFTAFQQRPPSTPSENPPEVDEPVPTKTYTRAEMIAIICRIADEMGEDRVEILGGALAESGEHDLDPWTYRDGVWPDKSAGPFQQTILYASVGDHTNTAANIAVVRAAYADPEFATREAIKQYQYWRHDPEVSPLQAWCGYNGGARFYHAWQSSPNLKNYRDNQILAAQILAADAPAPTFNASLTTIAQEESFDCSETSLLWILRAWGRGTTDDWLEGAMLNGTSTTLPIMSARVGLLDHTGAGVTTLVNNEYGELGFVAQDRHYVSFDDVGNEVDDEAHYGVMIGGQAFNHWVAVRGVDRARRVLKLMNPSNGHKGVGQEMTEHQFLALGNFSMVMVGYRGFRQDEPEPIPVDPKDAKIAQLETLVGVAYNEDGAIRQSLDAARANAESLVNDIRSIEEFLERNRPGSAA